MEVYTLRSFTLREWKYLTNIFNIRSGYEHFQPAEIDRVVDVDIIYKDNLEFFFPDVDDLKEFKERSIVEYTEYDYGCIDLDKSKVYVPKFFYRNYKRYLNIDGNIGHYFDDIEKVDEYNAFDNPHCKIQKFYINTEPREEQLPLFEKIDKHLTTSSILQGIIQAAPGYGKTYSSLKISSNLKLRTLIVVPNDVLLNQWKEAILKFSNLAPEDIGILQGSDPQYLIKECEKEVNLIIINSLYSQIKRLGREFVFSLYKNIGLVFYDEAHVSGAAESFSKTSNVFLTNNIIGLTATPYRKGLNEFLLINSIGEIFFKSEHQNLIPSIYIHNCWIETDQKKIDSLAYFRNDYTRFLAIYNSLLSESDVYFNYLADWIAFRLHEGHKVAILFSTNKMIFKMANLLKYKYKIDSGVIIGETEKEVKKIKPFFTQKMIDQIYEVYLEVYPRKRTLPKLIENGNIKDKDYKLIEDINNYRKSKNLDLVIIAEPERKLTEMEVAKTKPVTISNFQSMSAGYDDDKISSMIFGSIIVGKVGVIQSIGRATRANPDKIQTIPVHFMWSQFLLQYFPDLHWTLIRNIKVQYPTADFHMENFPVIEKPQEPVELPNHLPQGIPVN